MSPLINTSRDHLLFDVPLFSRLPHTWDWTYEAKSRFSPF